MQSRRFSLLFVTLFFLSFTSCVGYETYIAPTPKRSVLVVPVQNQLTPYESPVERYTVVHEVAPLETLWRISKMYDVPQASITRVNNLNFSAKLKTGQKLTIPDAAPITPLVSLYPNKRWKYIVIHHTATDIGNAKMVNQWHQRRGFEHGLGYHFLIDNGTSGKADGQIEISPRWVKQKGGAHTKGMLNEKGIGVALVGNFSKTLPTDAQMDSLIFLVRELMDYYNIPRSRVIGHRDAKNAKTECPGKLFPWSELKSYL